MDSLAIRWLHVTGAWTVLELSDGVSRGYCMTAKVKSCCSVVVHFPSLLYSALRVRLDQGGCYSVNAAQSGHSFAVRRNTDLLPRCQVGRPLPLDTDISDHRALPLYQPSFTLGIPPGICKIKIWRITCVI